MNVWVVGNLNGCPYSRLLKVRLDIFGKYCEDRTPKRIRTAPQTPFSRAPFSRARAPESTTSRQIGVENARDNAPGTPRYARPDFAGVQLPLWSVPPVPGLWIRPSSCELSSMQLLTKRARAFCWKARVAPTLQPFGSSRWN